MTLGGPIIAVEAGYAVIRVIFIRWSPSGCVELNSWSQVLQRLESQLVRLVKLPELSFAAFRVPMGALS